MRRPESSRSATINVYLEPAGSSWCTTRTVAEPSGPDMGISMLQQPEESLVLLYSPSGKSPSWMGAPMASINGSYVGPIRPDEVPDVIEAVRRGEEPLPDRQLKYRKSVDPNAAR